MQAEVRIVALEKAGRAEAGQFIELPFAIYRGCPQWVPSFRGEMRRILERRHPFFGHSQGEFFIARRGGRTVGRIAALENTRSNQGHGRSDAHFHFLDFYDDPEALRALLEAASDWARRRGLQRLIGPGGFGASTGSGVLVEGFEHRAAMNMMGYNHPYYSKRLEELGFSPYQELYSAYLSADTFRLPDRIRTAAQIVLKRGNFELLAFRSKGELIRIASQLGRVYNEALGGLPEAYPLSEAEIRQLTDELAMVADPSLIKVIAYRGEVAGFVFGFPDLSAALQRAQGRLNPFTVLDLLREYRRTDRLIVNGAGILPRCQRLGGNALLYSELEKIGRSRHFRHVEMTQVAETTALMLSDIQTLGGRIYKTHRLYQRTL